MKYTMPVNFKYKFDKKAYFCLNEFEQKQNREN